MNPFYHGNPVKSHQFLGRKKELRRASQRISTSQSTAIVGEPRTGKTSVLLYLAAPENHTHLYGDEAEQKRIFTYLDASTFDQQINQANFWMLAFAPLFSENSDTKLTNLYQDCVSKGFDSHSLGKLLDELERQHYHLVLLVDEFDVMLNLPQLCCAEFFGSLRSLASIKSALSLVVALRQSISKLNTLTQQLNNTGSPYFNIFEEYNLLPFSETDVELLLERANNRFTTEDIDFIIHAAGYHPYFLQTIAAELWNIYDGYEESNSKVRRIQAGQKLHDVATKTLSDTWRAWSPQMRMAITVVALANTPKLLEKRLFNSPVLLRDLRDFAQELRNLEKQGYIKKDKDNWCILPAAFQWWLADELTKIVRSEKDFAGWLQAQEWDGLLTKNEKQQLSKACNSLIGWAKDGIPELIKAFAGEA